MYAYLYTERKRIKIMCMKNSSEMKTLYYAFRLRRHSKRYNLRIIGLNRIREEDKYYNNMKKRELGTKVEMEIKNLRLYMENQSIMKENQKLREKALVLHQENQALLSQLQHKFRTQPKY